MSACAKEMNIVVGNEHIEDYHGDTYVAYLDISGFSEMMSDIKSAGETLDRFFSVIFNLCEDNHSRSPEINVIVAFDCCVIFTRNANARDKHAGLLMILDFVRRANQTFVAAAHSRPFTTTSSIAYGSFDYQNRKETADLRKNYLFGHPYVNVALDQKKGRPKIRPGECRLLDKCVLRRKRTFGDPLLSCVMKRGRRRYFYWMLENPDDRDDFEREYKEAYKHRKRDNYAGVIRVLQRYAAGRGPQRDMGTPRES